MSVTTTLAPEPGRIPLPVCPDPAAVERLSWALRRGDVSLALRVLAEAR